MWLPTKLYEALPLLYATIGALFLMGALYIGVGQGLMPVYMAIGLSCVIAGIYVTYLRYNARSFNEAHSAQG